MQILIFYFIQHEKIIFKYNLSDKCPYKFFTVHYQIKFLIWSEFYLLWWTKTVWNGFAIVTIHKQLTILDLGLAYVKGIHPLSKIELIKKIILKTQYYT